MSEVVILYDCHTVLSIVKIILFNVCDSIQFVLHLHKIRDINIMKRELLPSQKRTLAALGENIKYARLRRDLSSEQVSERASIARSTLVKIEKGDEGVAIGYYFRVLIVLGLDKDILSVAKDDQLGRALQDAKLDVKQRASKK